MKIFKITSTLLLAMLLSANFLTAQSWLKTGNPGVLATDYIGTQNNTSLNFKVYGQNGGKIVPNGPTFLGHLAGNSSSGATNIAIGYQSLAFASLSNDNTGVGYQTLKNTNGGNGNAAFGAYALATNRYGLSNSAVGAYAAAGNLDGTHNTALGNAALNGNSLGSYNTAIGSLALLSSLQSNNTAVGYSALQNLANGSDNCAQGSLALKDCANGGANSAFGTYALQVNQSSGNSGFGFKTMALNTTGNSNTAIGYKTMYSNVGGTRNTLVGADADVTSASLTNANAFGNQAFVNADNKVRIGNIVVTAIEGQVAYTYPSDGRFKTNITEEVQGLNFITRLRPVVYNFDTRKFDEFLTQNMPDSIRNARLAVMDYAPSTAIRQTGFIAQEVEKTAKEIGYDFNGVHAPVAANDNYSIAYSQFVMPLVKSVQELNATNIALQARLDAQEALIQKVLATKGDVDATKQNAASVNAPLLGQNAPNPTDGETTIQYYVPESMACNTGKCLIALHDVNGRLIQTVPVTVGKGSITLQLGHLADGIYSYQLIVNDAVVATHKLVVSK